jgi:hypothetical protein
VEGKQGASFLSEGLIPPLLIKPDIATDIFPMPAAKFIGSAFRLVRTLDLVIEVRARRLQARAEIFQDPVQRTHFRYRVWYLETFGMRTNSGEEVLPHECLTTLCLPNLGSGDYFEAEDADAAERKFYEDFQQGEEK